MDSEGNTKQNIETISHPSNWQKVTSREIPGVGDLEEDQEFSDTQLVEGKIVP